MFRPGNGSFETRSLRPPNLLPDDPEPRHHEKRPAKRGTRIFSCFFIILIIVATALGTALSRWNDNFFVGIKNGFMVRQLTHIFSNDSNMLQGEEDDRINFLLMGIGGPGHDGPYLTDTIILASYKPSTNEAAMLSIPRDLIVPTDGGRYQKVNHIYALNQRNGFEKAFTESKEIIGNTFGLTVHYMGVVDFQGFVELIDTLGKIEVDVERTFTDYQFPAGPNKTQVVSFEAGVQKMDGETALNFARSRHGNNGEGSDFARSKRQQKILIATKKKLSSFNTLFNPLKITTLFNLVGQYTKTDIEPWEVVKLTQTTKDIQTENIYTYVLDDAPGGYLYSGISSTDGAYILQPIGGDYFPLRSLAQNVFKDNEVKREAARVVVQNGTGIPLLATTISRSLERADITPLAFGNAEKKDQRHTEVYDYTDGMKPATRRFLESWFDVTAQSNIPLEFLGFNIATEMDLIDESGEAEELDFLIILGEDVQSKERQELIRTLTAEELASTSTDEFATTTLDVPDTELES